MNILSSSCGLNGGIGSSRFERSPASSAEMMPPISATAAKVSTPSVTFSRNCAATRMPACPPIICPRPYAEDTVPRHRAGTRSDSCAIIAAATPLTTSSYRHHQPSIAPMPSARPNANSTRQDRIEQPMIHGLRLPNRVRVRSEQAPSTMFDTSATSMAMVENIMTSETLFAGSISLTRCGNSVEIAP